MKMPISCGGDLPSVSVFVGSSLEMHTCGGPAFPLGSSYGTRACPASPGSGWMIMGAKAVSALSLKCHFMRTTPKILDNSFQRPCCWSEHWQKAAGNSRTSCSL